MTYRILCGMKILCIKMTKVWPSDWFSQQNKRRSVVCHEWVWGVCIVSDCIPDSSTEDGVLPLLKNTTKEKLFLSVPQFGSNSPRKEP